MRAYLPASRSQVDELAGGAKIHGGLIFPASDDEVAEFEAMAEAADQGVVVIAVDVSVTDEAVELANIASWHVDLDASGFLAWFATQEIDQVRSILVDRG